MERVAENNIDTEQPTKTKGHVSCTHHNIFIITPVNAGRTHVPEPCFDSEQHPHNIVQTQAGKTKAVRAREECFRLCETTLKQALMSTLKMSIKLQVFNDLLLECFMTSSRSSPEAEQARQGGRHMIACGKLVHAVSRPSGDR